MRPKILIGFIFLLTLVGCGPIEAFKEHEDVPAFSDAADAIASMSKDQLSELSDDTVSAFNDFVDSRDVCQSARDHLSDVRSKVTQYTQMLENGEIDKLSEYLDLNLEDIYEPSGNGNFFTNTWDKCSNFFSQKTTEITAWVAEHSPIEFLKDGAYELIQQRIEAVEVKAKAEYDNALDKMRDCRESFDTAAASDSVLQDFMQTGKTTSELENEKIGTIVIIVVAIIILILIIILLLSRRKPKQPAVMIAPSPAPVPLPAPQPHAQASADMDLDYASLLDKMCDARGLKTADVLKSFNGDARAAVESLRVS